MQRPAQQLPPAVDGERPYGLALELLHNQEPSAFISAQPPRGRTSRRALGPSLQGAARLGESPRPDSAGPGQHPPPLDPFTVMEMAANQEGLPEPDYGLVAELKNRVAPDPFATDFGMAAEVARRRERERSKSPLARGLGILPPLRARRRLDPVMDSDAFGVDGRRRRRDPFSQGDEDPFALADEQLKVPKELLHPFEPSQQELPGGVVPLKGEDGSEASGVSGDEAEYGIAEELGVDPETARRQREEQLARERAAQQNLGDQQEPAGHKYVYDEDTGMLISTEGGQGDGGRRARQYIEDETTGVFYKLHSSRRKLMSWLRRKEAGLLEEDDEDDKGFRGRLRRTLVFLVNFFFIIGLFAQGLLGGFALLNFFMTYMLYSSGTLTGFLAYYAPLAQNNARIYYSLSVVSVIASTSRLARDKLRNFEPRFLMLAAVDYLQMLLYVAAYICTTLCVPLDDELTYESNRNPRFYELTFSSGFKRRLSIWHLLNILRTLFAGIGWTLVCYQNSPYVFESTLKSDLRRLQRQQAALEAAALAAMALKH